MREAWEPSPRRLTHPDISQLYRRARKELRACLAYPDRLPEPARRLRLERLPKPVAGKQPVARGGNDRQQNDGGDEYGTDQPPDHRVSIIYCAVLSANWTVTDLPQVSDT